MGENPVRRSFPGSVDPAIHESARASVESAHELVREVRCAYLASDWERADRLTAAAVERTTQALCMVQNIMPPSTLDLRLSRQMTMRLFGERTADEIFNRLDRYLRGDNDLVVDDWPEDDETAERRVRRSLAVSSEYVALVDCYICM